VKTVLMLVFAIVAALALVGGFRYFKSARGGTGRDADRANRLAIERTVATNQNAAAPDQ
jgi:hypothetical protein